MSSELDISFQVPSKQATLLNELSRLTGKPERELLVQLIDLGAAYLLTELRMRKGVQP